MTQDEARGIIRHLALKHKEFQLKSIQVRPDGFFMTFAFMDYSLDTVDRWIRKAGGVPMRVGVEGTGDRVVMTAEVK